MHLFSPVTLLTDSGGLAILVLIVVSITKPLVELAIPKSASTSVHDVILNAYVYVVAEAVAFVVAALAHVLTQASAPLLLGVGVAAATTAIATYHVNSRKTPLSIEEVIGLLEQHGLFATNAKSSGDAFKSLGGVTLPASSTGGPIRTVTTAPSVTSSGPVTTPQPAGSTPVDKAPPAF